MEQKPCHVIILADAPGALTNLAGISVLERLLRMLQRAGVREVTIVSATPDAISAEVARPSWARAEVSIEVRDKAVLIEERTLVVSAAYYDARLLVALLQQQTTTLLSNHAGDHGAALVCPNPANPALSTASLFSELTIAALRGQVATLPIDAIPSYIANMRSSVPLAWFSPTTPALSTLAEKHIFDSAQNGTLDLPAILHAPIETWIIRRLCRTSITPNQITLFTALVSAIVLFLFGAGRFIAGTCLALAVGILDGLDGKQARVKVETTPLGQREHALDYLLELSWWVALACHFGTAYAWLALLVGSDLFDRLAKRRAKQLTGRNLDDLTPFDRFVRLIGGRRNIYIWIFGVGLLLRSPGEAFIGLCCWGGLTAAVHVARAVCITAARSKSAAQ